MLDLFKFAQRGFVSSMRKTRCEILPAIYINCVPRPDRYRLMNSNHSDGFPLETVATYFEVSFPFFKRSTSFLAWHSQSALFWAVTFFYNSHQFSFDHHPVFFLLNTLSSISITLRAEYQANQQVVCFGHQVDSLI